MTLGDLIEALEAHTPTAEVTYDDGGYPDGFASWRGVYAELTLCPNGPRTTVADLLKEAHAADGATFTGWKGGEYTMSRSTPVWADDEGCCTYYAITGSHTREDGALILVRTDIGEYR